MSGNPGEDFCFWQAGDTVVGTHGSYGAERFRGTASGNTLTGSITNNYGTYNGAVFTMSADGKTLSVYNYYGNSTTDTQAGTRISPITYVSGELASPPAPAYNASGWALPEVQRAGELGLIPGVLQNADLTAPITRAEFAAVAVKLYENLTGKGATPVSSNPFFTLG